MTHRALEASVSHAVEEVDYLRFNERTRNPAAPQCEWMHFVVRTPDADVIVNFSLIERAARADKATGNLVLLIRSRADGARGWEGDIDAHSLDRAGLGAGRIRLRLGESLIEYDRGFIVRARCRRRDVSVDLFLQPLSFPYLVHNVELGPEAVIHWAIVPRMQASGVVRWGGREARFEHASAYHDHNWGSFGASKLAWEWGCTLGVERAGHETLNAVMVRILDRTRTTATAQTLMLWQGAHRRRVFRGSEVTFRSEGWLRPAHALRVPRPLSLLGLGSATDVPARVHIHAATASGEVSAVFHGEDVARVLVPHEADLGTTLIHEVIGHLSLSGTLDGKAMNSEAPAFFEFMGESS